MSTTQTKPDVQAESSTESQPLRPWNVVLLDDQEHTYEYVIDMLGRIFGHSRRRAYELARTVDTEGRAVVATMHRELGELRVAQVRGFGVDPLLAKSTCSMRAILEPAEGGDGSGDEDGGRG
jgi:ATP-dependent Clp protease adaptor protein ClpS